MSNIFQKELARRLSSLAVFRGVLKHDTVSALMDYLRADGTDDKISLYGEFVSSLLVHGGNLSALLAELAFENENVYVRSVAKKVSVSESLKKNAESELKLLTEMTRLTAEDITRGIDYDGYLPAFDNEYTDILAEYNDRILNISKYGYGIFAGHTMFRLDGDEIVPIEAADDISMDRFVGYEDEHQKVIDNTVALTENRPAANILLFGDAGTGKSSTVKAVANMMKDKGVRLIELRKDQLTLLPYVMERISENPLKFIIFIDDLSFNKNDDCFSMLKAALEGSASAKAKNAVIYATSNRRHIVKETFSDRGEDDVHRADTMQELMSLSERFGLVVYFSKPSKTLYLDIVHELARRAGLDLDRAELDIKAEAYALAKGNRSPRAAEQFVESLL